MTDADRQRLAAILGMLGSDHAGERAAAALQAEAFRRKHRLTWEELLALPPTIEIQPQPQWTPPPPPANPAAPTDPGAITREGFWSGVVYFALMMAPLAISLIFRYFG